MRYLNIIGLGYQSDITILCKTVIILKMKVFLKPNNCCDIVG